MPAMVLAGSRVYEEIELEGIVSWQTGADLQAFTKKLCTATQSADVAYGG